MSIDVDDRNERYCSIGGVLYQKNAYPGYPEVLIQYPAGWSGRYDDIPDSVRKIRNGAFSGCTGLKGVTIPTSVTSIDSGAFDGCTGLLSIDVDDRNTEFCSIGGVLFNKRENRLDLYPKGRDGRYDIPAGVTSLGTQAFKGCTRLTGVTIPGSIQYIGNSTFSDCTSLTNVTIGSGVKDIGNSAFSDCSGLTNVTIPASVMRIGWMAFDGCTSLTDVYYTGTRAQWASISIETSNESLTNATIHYNWVENGMLSLPTGLTTIESEAFVDLPGVSTVYIPASVTDIADDAFDEGKTIKAPVGSYAITWAINHNFSYIED